MKKSIWENNPFGRMVVWCGVNWRGGSSTFSKHPFRQVLIFLIILFFKSSWCKIAIVQQGIELILSPEQQRRPLPFLPVFILLFWSSYKLHYQLLITEIATVFVPRQTGHSSSASSSERSSSGRLLSSSHFLLNTNSTHRLAKNPPNQ